MEWTDTWYTANGARGRPSIADETRGIDLSQTTIEHIAARRAEDLEANMQPLIDTIGNLTLLNQTENDGVANASFSGKRPVFERSSFAINRALTADNRQTWRAIDISARETEIVERCLRIFSLEAG